MLGALRPLPPWGEGARGVNTAISMHGQEENSMAVLAMGRLPVCGEKNCYRKVKFSLYKRPSEKRGRRTGHDN